MATGFSDTSAFLRELTLKSMLVLAPKVFFSPKLLILLVLDLSTVVVTQVAYFISVEQSNQGGHT